MQPPTLSTLLKNWTESLTGPDGSPYIKRMEIVSDAARWYAIYTKPQEEGRADSNLAAWGVETFSPRIRKRRLNQFTGLAVYVSQPLFPRYIFARFDAERMLHKVCYTRGVRGVVSSDYTPLVVEDEIIALIRSQVGEDDFVQLGEELKRGDEVRISDGVLRGMSGVFDRAMKDRERVTVLLTTINYQASVTVERAAVQKTPRAVCNA